MLLEAVQPVYDKLRAHDRVTHLYFTGPDRRVVLRVHDPEHHGDVVDRSTTLAAERSGSVAQGAELGPLGTFALRVVAPWSDQGKRLGYIELGAEIAHVLRRISAQLNLDTFALIDKSFLDRSSWQIGSRLFGRARVWKTLRHYRLADDTLDARERRFIAEHFAGDERIREVHDEDIARFGERYVQFKFVPIFDAIERPVGHVVIMRDITAARLALQRSVLTTAALCTLLAGALFLLVHRLVSMVERRLFTSERAPAARRSRC